jgi:hypothetical protein
MGFLDSPQAFTIQMKFPLPGHQLGLTGAKGEAITATLFTSSATTMVVPEPDADAIGEDDPLDALLE